VVPSRVGREIRPTLIISRVRNPAVAHTVVWVVLFALTLARWVGGQLRTSTLLRNFRHDLRKISGAADRLAALTRGLMRHPGSRWRQSLNLHLPAWVEPMKVCPGPHAQMLQAKFLHAR
jgi:hypothetical protein